MSIESNNQVQPAKQEEKKPSLLSEDFALQYPLNILLVEDNLINQKLATRILNKLGYTIDLANTGKEAVDLLKEKDYQLILMDVLMPEMDGLEATQLIRKHNIHQPIIIALTANEERTICLKAGMDNYMAKPINLQLLVDLLKEYSAIIGVG